MNPNKTKTITFATLVAGANFALGLAAFQGLLQIDYFKYLLLGEATIMGGLLLFLYAKQLLVFTVLMAVIAYTLGLKNFLFLGDMKIPITFWGFYSLFWLLYFEIRTTLLGHRLRLLHPLYQFGIYMIFMMLSASISMTITGYLYFKNFSLPPLPADASEQFLIMAVGIPTLTIGLIKIIDMIGERHVLYFLLGTYHRPVEKRRIVLFLDMAGSTTMAEKMPARKGMELIAQFIFDAGTAFRIHGGDIINYTGDGLVVLWPTHQADKALAAYDMLSSRLASAQARYEKQFGIVPQFRIGLHAGKVVISQVGEEKLFLGLYGDVVNTAARIEQMNKEFGTRILFSRAFRQLTGPRWQKRIKALGIVELRGKDVSVEVFTLLSRNLGIIA